MNSQIKILLADESAVFLEQLRHVLERDPAFVIAGSANDAQRAVELLHRTQPDILILDEPTRGIDIGTKTEIQKLVLKLADEGKSLIFISSEIEEMLRTCNRMAVLRDGQKVGEIDEADMNQMNVMKAIAGGEQ